MLGGTMGQYSCHKELPVNACTVYSQLPILWTLLVLYLFAQFIGWLIRHFNLQWKRPTWTINLTFWLIVIHSCVILSPLYNLIMESLTVSTSLVFLYKVKEDRRTKKFSCLHNAISECLNRISAVSYHFFPPFSGLFYLCLQLSQETVVSACIFWSCRTPVLLSALNKPFSR